MKLGKLRKNVKTYTNKELSDLLEIYGWYGSEEGVNVQEQKMKAIVEGEVNERSVYGGGSRVVGDGAAS